MFTFDRFEENTIYGKHDFEVSVAMIEDWHELFPGPCSNEYMPAAMVSVVMMHAYVNIITPRPPGNIHAAQQFEIYRLPRIGEKLTTTVSCERKEVKKKRGWVHLAFETHDERGDVVFTAQFTSLPAA